MAYIGISSNQWDGMDRFRNPVKDPLGPFVATIGGAETYGRFMDQPYPTRLARALGVPVVNLGLVHGGLGAMLADPTIRRVLNRATVVVVECPDHRRWTNPFYRVHSKRSDRITTVLPRFYELFPRLEVPALGFVEQFWQLCDAHDPTATQQMGQAIQTAFVAAFKQFLGTVPVPVRLLSLSGAGLDLGTDLQVHSIRPSEAPSLRGFTVAYEDRKIARAMAGQDAHDRAARVLARSLAPEFKRPAQGVHGPSTASMG